MKLTKSQKAQLKEAGITIETSASEIHEKEREKYEEKCSSCGKAFENEDDVGMSVGRKTPYAWACMKCRTQAVRQNIECLDALVAWEQHVFHHRKDG